MLTDLQSPGIQFLSFIKKKRESEKNIFIDIVRTKYTKNYSSHKLISMYIRLFSHKNLFFLPVTFEN